MHYYVCCRNAYRRNCNQPKYITSSSWDNGVRTIVSKELNPNYPGDDIVNFAKTIYLLLPQRTSQSNKKFKINRF